MLRFHLPLIEPDVRFSRIRLSDKESRRRTRDVGPSRLETYHLQDLVQASVREACVSLARDLVLGAQPLAEPMPDVAVHDPIGLADGAPAEVVPPTDERAVELGYLVGDLIRSRSRPRS